jgi:hypothetical protein
MMASTISRSMVVRQRIMSLDFVPRWNIGRADYNG